MVPNWRLHVLDCHIGPYHESHLLELTLCSPSHTDPVLVTWLVWPQNTGQDDSNQSLVSFSGLMSWNTPATSKKRGLSEKGHMGITEGSWLTALASSQKWEQDHLVPSHTSRKAEQQEATPLASPGQTEALEQVSGIYSQGLSWKDVLNSNKSLLHYTSNWKC